MDAITDTTNDRLSDLLFEGLRGEKITIDKETGEPFFWDKEFEHKWEELERKEECFSASKLLHEAERVLKIKKRITLFIQNISKQLDKKTNIIDSYEVGCEDWYSAIYNSSYLKLLEKIAEQLLGRTNPNEDDVNSIIEMPIYDLHLNFKSFDDIIKNNKLIHSFVFGGMQPINEELISICGWYFLSVLLFFVQ